MDRVKDKVALVTGGAQGLGAAQCELLASEGAHVVVTDVRIEAAESLAAAIVSRGGSAIALRHDVADPQSWKSVIEKTIAHYGAFNVLVNNAGIDLRASIEDVTLDQWKRVIDTNLTGTFLGIQNAVAHMKAHGGGSIVNIASIAGEVGAAVTTAYGASKAGVINLTKTTALHCVQSRYGIRVNCVLPGPVATPMVVGTTDAPEKPEVIAWLGNMIPLGRLGEAREIAQAVLFLASDESSFCIGTALTADGGFTAQ